MTDGTDTARPAPAAERQYCRAYRLADLRRFPGWQEPADRAPLTDDSVVHLWDDLTVVASPVDPSEGVLWDTVDGAWERFCREDLNFDLPEDLNNG
ncbi:hypothetical protein OG871_36230 [Kitasatospora sp. NBC_00374]|uniref:hypothetical protein n=1 Tax=Kitasatospora sp. NBC_00374 TaxID=2975964 RepID=UPI0030E32E75